MIIVACFAFLAFFDHFFALISTLLLLGNGTALSFEKGLILGLPVRG